MSSAKNTQSVGNMFTGIDMLLSVCLQKNITYIAGTMLIANSINPTLLLRSC